LHIGNRSLLYVADAYYMRAELTDERHPVNKLDQIRAYDNNLRVSTVDKIRKFV